MHAKVRNFVFTMVFIVIYLFPYTTFASAHFIITPSLVSSSRAAIANAAMNSTDMEEKASHVLVGKVENIESHWDEERGSVYTYVKVYVEERLKGTTQDEYVVIKHRGGEIGNIGLLVSDEPRFLLGEKVKVYLKLEASGEFTVLDGWKGKISLVSPASSGFSYSGIHWDQNDLPVPYYINENCTLEEIEAVKASFQTWENDPESSMDYTYMGTTTRGNESLDGYNVVSWQPIDGPDGILAQAAYRFDLSSKLMSEFDIVFDTDETWSTTGEPNKFDVQNVGTHEVGHTLVLEDLYDSADSEQTMYGYSSPGETEKRTLEAGDLAGLRYIYPTSKPVVTINTSPSGLQIEVDGTNYTSPQSFEWTPNSTHTVNVPSTQSASVNTRYVFVNWSDGETQRHQITVENSSATITANYLTQHFATIETHGLISTYPAIVNFTQLGVLKTSSTSGSWSDWCDSGSVLTINSYIAVAEAKWVAYDTTSWTINSALTTTVNYVLHYPISFEAAFKNFKGLELSENPSSFTLQFPNGTISEQLNSSSVYYIQNGTTRWDSITWQGIEVAPPDANFDATDGNPMVNCLIYDFAVKVLDLFGFPIPGAHVSAKLSNGRTVNTQTGPDGVAVIRMAPKGRFTASISYLAQTVTVSDDVTKAALTSVEVKITFGLSILILLSVSGVLAAVLVVFLMLKMAKSKQMYIGGLSVW